MNLEHDLSEQSNAVWMTWMTRVSMRSRAPHDVKAETRPYKALPHLEVNHDHSPQIDHLILAIEYHNYDQARL